jgi:hypothetical protein
MRRREFLSWLNPIVLRLCAVDNPIRMNESADQSSVKRRYLWPWIVAVLVVLGILLAIMSVRQEAQRIREQRQPQMPNPAQ